MISATSSISASFRFVISSKCSAVACTKRRLTALLLVPRVVCEYAEHVSTRCWRTIDQRVEEITRQAPHRAGRERCQGRRVAAAVDDSDLVQGTRRGEVAEANASLRRGRDGSGHATMQEQQEMLSMMDTVGATR